LAKKYDFVEEMPASASIIRNTETVISSEIEIYVTYVGFLGDRIIELYGVNQKYALSNVDMKKTKRAIAQMKELEHQLDSLRFTEDDSDGMRAYELTPSIKVFPRTRRLQYEGELHKMTCEENAKIGIRVHEMHAEVRDMKELYRESISGDLPRDIISLENILSNQMDLAIANYDRFTEINGCDLK
jgi:hypothetical protein